MKTCSQFEKMNNSAQTVEWNFGLKIIKSQLKKTIENLAYKNEWKGSLKHEKRPFKKMNKKSAENKCKKSA